MIKLAKAIISDLRVVVVRAYSYCYWNARGTRVALGGFAHPKARLAEFCAFFGRTRIGRSAAVGHFTYGTDCIIENAIIGRFCSIAPGSVIGPDNHPVHSISTSPKVYDVLDYPELRQKAIIGDDVWVGTNALVVCGVSIGDGAVIGGGAVVTADVEPFVIVGGVPARPLGRRKCGQEFVNSIRQTDDPILLREIALSFRKKLKDKRSEKQHTDYEKA